jgi:hypothetical protein
VGCNCICQFTTFHALAGAMPLEVHSKAATCIVYCCGVSSRNAGVTQGASQGVAFEYHPLCIQLVACERKPLLYTAKHLNLPSSFFLGVLHPIIKASTICLYCCYLLLQCRTFTCTQQEQDQAEQKPSWHLNGVTTQRVGPPVAKAPQWEVTHSLCECPRPWWCPGGPQE